MKLSRMKSVTVGEEKLKAGFSSAHSLRDQAFFSFLTKRKNIMCMDVLPVPHMCLVSEEAKRGHWIFWNWNCRW